MCGIAGYVALDPIAPVDGRWVKPMCESLAHRGPDAEGYHLDPHAALGHRRLSIIDLATGDQPVYNSDRSKVIVYNGEIYNFMALRSELEATGFNFRTRSDTEVVLAAYEAWGVRSLDRFNGMFAFAIWDVRERKLFCARDRFGKKPFYYAEVGGHFTFASEMKAMLKVPFVRPRLDRKSLVRYLALDFVPAPATIYGEVKKLPGGHYVTVKEGHVRVGCYWDLPEADDRDREPSRIEEELFDRLSQSVNRRLIADVPVGVFLSGGLDSTSVVAAMRRDRSTGIRTFCIDFAEPTFSEGRLARSVSHQFGTEHFEQRLEEEDAASLLARIAPLQDEPVSDTSFLPMFLLSEFASRHVKVALGGDGGDELLVGYPTYQAHRLAGFYSSLPGVLRRTIVEPVVRRLPVSHRYLSPDFRAKRFIEGMGFPAPIRSYVWNGSFRPQEMIGLMVDASPAEMDTRNVYSEVLDHYDRCKAASEIQKQLYLDLKLYLQEGVLVKVDRASMAHSLEIRAPFLDVEFAEFVWCLPMRLKFPAWRTKVLLRRAMKDRLPREILIRGKQGFATPVGAWFRRGLNSALRTWLNRDRLMEHGLFRPAYIEGLLNEHLTGGMDHRKKLWNLMTFQMWWEVYGRNPDLHAPLHGNDEIGGRT